MTVERRRAELVQLVLVGGRAVLGPELPAHAVHGRPSARESSARSAMPKFECSWSGGTHRSSVNQKSTPDQSSRAAAARS
jgi:hypothetical protein